MACSKTQKERRTQGKGKEPNEEEWLQIKPRNKNKEKGE